MWSGCIYEIRSCSLGDELTGIHEVARGKTNLACLYCGVGALASQAALFKQIQEPLLLSEAKPCSNGSSEYSTTNNSSKKTKTPDPQQGILFDFALSPYDLDRPLAFCLRLQNLACPR
jgi:hypothetical protein